MLLALAAAASWGASDFLGGLAGRRSRHDATVAITFVSQLIGFVGLTVAALLFSPVGPTTRDVVIGAAAGVGGAVGVSLLYRGLRSGKMGVVAPITGAGGASIPVVYGALTGQVPTALGWVGVVVALAAIVLVSREPTAVDVTTSDARRGLRAPGVLEAIGAGVGFAIIFIMLDQTSDASGLWPLVPMKAAATVFILAVSLLARRSLRPPAPAVGLVIAVGVLDNLANVTYLLATRAGLLSVVAVVSSLYPVGTVLLARGVLDEHLHRHQLAGLGLALTAVVLIALG